MNIFPTASLVSLRDQFVNFVFKNSSSSDLTPIKVIVPSKILADWFQVQIAKKCGVCLGLEFFLPQDFIQQIASFCSPETSSRSRKLSPWDKEAIRWAILPELSKYAEHLGAKDLSPGGRDALAIAQEIADRFDQYGHYRPEWIEKWRDGLPCFSSSDETWQRALWQELFAKIGDASSAQHPSFVLEKAKTDPLIQAEIRKNFPEVFVIGVGSINPLLIGFLKILDAAGCELSLHIALPSLHYLGDLALKKTPEDFLRLEMLDQSLEDWELPDSHPLLNSMGKRAVGSFLLLGDLDENYARWPAFQDLEKPISPSDSLPPPSLLAQIQEDIRSLINRPRTSGAAETAFSPDSDRSIRIHSCHGPRREMEVLRDEIFRAFTDLDGLRPDEVVIVTPSLSTYAPLVASVFPHGGNLPVFLTELPASEMDPCLEAVLAILELAQGRNCASELLGLIRLRAVRILLECQEDDASLEKLEGWVRASGITEWLDASTKKEAQLPDDPTGTWEFGIGRIVAGHWLGEEESTAAEPPTAASRFFLPVSDTLDSGGSLQKNFLGWLAGLSKTLHEWKTPAAPGEWANRFQDYIENVLSPSTHLLLPPPDLSPFFLLREIPCSMEIESAAILDWLREQTEKLRNKGRIAGGIAFGSLKQLQCIPCRVLAFVGMEETAFPAKNRKISWDLMQEKPKIWDRNPRSDDRQLFLDALLTPTDRLIITGNTQNIRTGKTEPFSSCVDELLSALEPLTPPDSRKKILVKHRILPVAEDYFLPGPIQSFDTENLQIARQIAAAASEASPFVPPPFFDRASPPPTHTPETLSLQQLVAFWKNPAAAFLQAHLIAPPAEEQDDTALNQHPLSLDRLQSWGLRDSCLRSFLRKDGALPEIKARLRGDRALPLAHIGDAIWETETHKMDALREVVASVLPDPAKEIPVGFSFRTQSGSEIHITASLPLANLPSSSLPSAENAPASALLYYRAGKMDKPKHWIQPWIQAIVASAANHHFPSLVLAEDRLEIRPLLPAIAAPLDLLEILVEGYLMGQTRPLCYAPVTSSTLAQELAQEKGLTPKVMKAWYGDDYNNSFTEGRTAEALLAWRNQDPFASPFAEEWTRWAELIAAPLDAWKDATQD